MAAILDRVTQALAAAQDASRQAVACCQQARLAAA